MVQERRETGAVGESNLVGLGERGGDLPGDVGQPVDDALHDGGVAKVLERITTEFKNLEGKKVRKRAIVQRRKCEFRVSPSKPASYTLGRRPSDVFAVWLHENGVSYELALRFQASVGAREPCAFNHQCVYHDHVSVFVCVPCTSESKKRWKQEEQQPHVSYVHVGVGENAEL